MSLKSKFIRWIIRNREKLISSIGNRKIVLLSRLSRFQSGGTMEHWKVLSATMVGQPENFLNSRCSTVAKTVTFWPWWQPFVLFLLFLCFLFFLLLPFFPFATSPPFSIADLLEILKIKFNIKLVFKVQKPSFADVRCNHMPFFKIFSSSVHFCQNFQIFCPFLPFFWKNCILALTF